MNTHYGLTSKCTQLNWQIGVSVRMYYNKYASHWVGFIFNRTISTAKSLAGLMLTQAAGGSTVDQQSMCELFIHWPPGSPVVHPVWVHYCVALLHSGEYQLPVVQGIYKRWPTLWASAYIKTQAGFQPHSQAIPFTHSAQWSHERYCHVKTL